MTELGETKMDSSPRTSRARPFWPVRILSPGLKVVSSVSEAGSAPEWVTQTSPDDLLTCQAAFCATAPAMNSKLSNEAKSVLTATDMEASYLLRA